MKRLAKRARGTSGVRKRLGLLFLPVAFAVGGYGIWLITTRDVQGGRHEAGAMILGVAVLAAIAAAVLLGSRHRG